MKLLLPRVLLLQLLQQTNMKLKINLLMGSHLSKQLLCAKAALHLAVTTVCATAGAVATCGLSTQKQLGHPGQLGECHCQDLVLGVLRADWASRGQS